jgi:predicted metal-dependent hydrolase
MVARAEIFEVVAPWRVSNHVIIQFISQQLGWMKRQASREAKRAQVQTSIWPLCCLAEEIIPYRGETLRLQIRYGGNQPVIQQADNLIISLPWQVSCSQIESEIKKQLLGWYQQKALSLIEESIARYCPMLGRWPKAVKLKQQKSRWGSCGITERIYINWLLVLAPPGTLEYVVVHELAHLFHRNHGQRFWAKVASCMTDFAEYDRWLNRNGYRLKLPAGWQEK